MPTREEMIAALQGGSAPAPAAQPTREQMIAELAGTGTGGAPQTGSTRVDPSEQADYDAQVKAEKNFRETATPWEKLKALTTGSFPFAPSESPADRAARADYAKTRSAGGKAWDVLTGKATPANPHPQGVDETPVGTMIRGLGIASGVGRTALAQAAQGAYNLGADKPVDAVRPGDWRDALAGHAPRLSEYADRAGIPTGPALSDYDTQGYADPGKGKHFWSAEKGGKLDFNARDAVLLPLEFASDPTTWLGAKPVQKALEGTGKSIYRSAFKRADAVAEKYGKDLVPSEAFIQNGMPTGTARGIAEESSRRANELLGQRNALLAGADAKGATTSMQEAMAPAREYINQLRASRDPQKIALADSLETRVQQYEAQGGREAQTITEPRYMVVDGEKVPIGETTQHLPAQSAPTTQQGAGMTTSLYNDTTDAAWNMLKRTPDGQKATKALAAGTRQAYAQGAERAVPGAAEQLRAINEELGTHLTAASTLDREALKGEAKNLVTSVDPIVYGVGAAGGHGAPGGAWTLVAKKLADLSKTTWARTNLGRNMVQDAAPVAGATLDPYLRQRLIENQNRSTDRGPKSLWERILDQ